MAMVRFGPEIVEINGKMGGDIWRYDWCKQHCQSMGRYIDKEPTKPQKIRRKQFTKLLSYVRTWGKESKFVQLWQAYCNSHPETNKKGEVYSLAWHQGFISYNLNRVISGKPVEQYPP